MKSRLLVGATIVVLGASMSCKKSAPATGSMATNSQVEINATEEALASLCSAANRLQSATKTTYEAFSVLANVGCADIDQKWPHGLAVRVTIANQSSGPVSFPVTGLDVFSLGNDPGGGHPDAISGYRTGLITKMTGQILLEVGPQRRVDLLVVWRTPPSNRTLRVAGFSPVAVAASASRHRD
jgi:hypothetical protein